MVIGPWTLNVNPPNPPGYAPNQGTEFYPTIPSGPPPWSALAITAFVCSLIGFLGFTAVLGIILGIVGIIVTKQGVRRGRGLAIAAIPISVVTGSIGGLIVLGIVSLGQMTTTTRQFEGVLAGSGADVSKKIDYIYAHATPDFQNKISRERLAEWLAEMGRKHGKLVELDRKMIPGTLTSSGSNAVLNYPGKFVNGQGLVQFHFEQRSLTKPLLDDVEIDGSSPRGAQPSP